MENNDEEFEDAMEVVQSPSASIPSEAPMLTAPTKKTKMDKLKKLNPVSLKKSPKQEKRPNNDQVDEPTNDIPLHEAIEDAKKALNLFLNNEFEASKRIIEPLADKSIYHAMGAGVFAYLEAVMTFEQAQIANAIEVLNTSSETINKCRIKGGGIVDSLTKFARDSRQEDANAYSELEMHAELCYAECMLFRAVLTFCEDENLVSFVKAGLKVRSCYQSFRECWNILQHRNWEGDIHKNDFESGVRVGVGTFNLMISLLPPRITRLLEFIGFGGKKDNGLQELLLVYEEKSALRQFFSAMVLLGYHLFISTFTGNVEVDLKLCKKILDEKLAMYPKGVFFLFFKGRFNLVQGEMNEAAKWYKLACESEWPQFHHFCYWELTWCYQFSQEWWSAIHYADLLLKESKWSKTFYSYMKAAFMCMVQDELTDEQRKEQIELMTNVPKWKQRIAGKSIPMEKFAIAKSKLFLEQGNNLILPSLELIYMWNGFRTLGSRYKTIEPLYILVEKAIKAHERNKDTTYKNENWCLLLLLRGMCFKYMNSPLQAEECFKEIQKYSGKLKADNYLIPYSLYEYALLVKDSGDYQTALDILSRARNDFKDYSLQSRLHFRIHSAQGDLKNLMSGKKEDNVSSVEEALDAFEDDQECEFLDAEEGEFKDPDYSTSNLAFKTAITDDDARKIIEGKQLK